MRISMHKLTIIITSLKNLINFANEKNNNVPHLKLKFVKIRKNNVYFYEDTNSAILLLN